MTQILFGVIALAIGVFTLANGGPNLLLDTLSVLNIAVGGFMVGIGVADRNPLIR